MRLRSNYWYCIERESNPRGYQVLQLVSPRHRESHGGRWQSLAWNIRREVLVKTTRSEHVILDIDMSRAWVW